MNLAENAKAKASTFRGKSSRFGAHQVTDGNKDTYWATDDGITSSSLEIDLGNMHMVKYVVLQEFIPLGQRVKSFDIEILREKRWIKVSEGTTIGYKRILRIAPAETSRLRINIKASKACPVISNVEVY